MVEDHGPIVFNNPGVYSVTLSVTDLDGSVTTDTVTASIEAAMAIPGVYMLLDD